ncbi:ebs-bah-phd domain-containing [Lecanosticta acicola]|uniref:Ebs-bah-phd domain-containing n=1 Tax=Lecanosticta acicola TaxID=111012 RepID=A0AAI8Z1K6_9PEZI|nr:ebs-bah-phd domain-containing [Lecanosticta acicola]
MLRNKRSAKIEAQHAATTNGAPAPVPAPAPASAQRLAKPPPFKDQPELTPLETEQMKNWLDDAPRPLFTVSVSANPANSKKRKRDDENIEQDLFENRLSCKYSVHPKDKWDKLRKYRKFTVGSESIAIGACVVVVHDEDSEEDEFDMHAQWKAKVLEVRALDSEHVYVRLAWLNRPEDLEGGRKDYHGRNELIPSNQMDIVDALAINGQLEVKRWNDTSDDDDNHQVDQEQFFWRQTFDFAGSKTFSRLKLICVDNKPHNPDELILQCSAEGCRKWMHVKCIAEKAVKAAERESKKKKAEQRARPKNATDSNSSVAVVKASLRRFTAEVFIKGLSNDNEANAEAATEHEIVITDSKGEKYSQALKCLHCDTEVDD